MTDNQGRFTSDGTTKLLSIRADADWMCVYNYTNAGATGDDSVKFYWQRGMTDGTGLRYFKSGGGNALSLTTLASPNGFTPVDTSSNPLSAAIAISAATDATQPVFSTANTSDLVDGDVVLTTGLTGQENLAGFEFKIDNVVSNTSFSMANAIATTPGAAATAGNWRKVKWDPIYYPRRRFISDISAVANAVVTCSADHGFTVGQEIRMNIPSEFGMTEMDGLLATITAVTASTFTTDIDASAFTAFKFPLPAIVPFTFAQAVPVGQNTAQSLSSSVDILADAADNQSIIAMSLPVGADAPGGASGDVMYWFAGRSFSVDNQ